MCQCNILVWIEIISIKNRDIFFKPMSWIKKCSQAPSWMLRVQTNINIQHMELVLKPKSFFRNKKNKGISSWFSSDGATDGAIQIHPLSKPLNWIRCSSTNLERIYLLRFSSNWRRTWYIFPNIFSNSPNRIQCPKTKKKYPYLEWLLTENSYREILIYQN